MRLLLSMALVCIASQLTAQQIPLINSGEIFQRVSTLEDSGKYESAIKELLAIPKRDTNYVWGQLRLGEMYVYNKQYNEAEAVADQALKRRSKFRASLLATKALALESRKEYDKAIAVLQSALKDYPYDIQLRYQLATSYHNKLDYTNAVKAYYDVLEISPYSYNVHLNLGGIAMWAGHKTQAILSYGMYLALNNTDNAKLSQLESICSNQAENEGAAKERTGGVPNGFEKLDQILRSKVAMDKKFKTEVPVDAATVKQFEMIFKQLSTVSKDSNDPWVKFYVPAYETIRDQKMMETFLYHILASSPIESVKKWNEKNEKARTAFFKVVNESLIRDRADVRAPESLGVGTRTHAEYNEENRVTAVGGVANNKTHGKWVYFDTNSEKIAEGIYENGSKKGEWKYYTNAGEPSSRENIDTGEVTTLYPTGEKEVHYFLKGEDVEGEITFFYPCGSVSEKRTHKDGKRFGKGQLFYETGAVKADYQYLDGELSGVWTDYDIFGKVKAKTPYKNGERDGLYEVFWSNGKAKYKDTYKEGKLSGPAEGYHDNGKLSYKGSHIDDHAVGEWVYYNRYGEQTERRFYDNEGNVDQENIFYHEGKLYYKTVNAKGIVVGATYYDKAGKEIWKGASADGSFDVKHFYSTGQLLSEGKFKKGVRDGKWKQYHRSGILTADYNYLDGKFEGEQTDFFNNGKKKLVGQYKAGKREGYMIEYFMTGGKQSEGWYTNDETQQQWLMYYPDGSVSEDRFYLNGQLTDTTYAYSVEGKITSKTFYKAGELVYEHTVNPVQTSYIMDASLRNKATELKYENGTTMVKYNTQCGLLDGAFGRFYADGKPYTQFTYVGGTTTGTYKGYDELGNADATGPYLAGEPLGLWRYLNPNGKPSQEARYANSAIDSTLVNYYESGEVYFTAEYRGGKRHGALKYYGPDGTLIVEKLFDDDQLVSLRTLGKNGKFGEWVGNTPNMDVVAYYPNGTKALEEKYVSNIITGVKRMWYPDGKLCMEYNYVDGSNEGLATDYYSNGKVCRKAPYHLDQVDGKMEHFLENGMPLLTSEYKLGKKHGITTVYSKGVKTKEVIYYNGHPMK